MPALGEEFRSAREARGLTLSEVAEQIHIRSVYLNAIENEDWPAIGAPVYVRGFIRTYARFLGLDAQDAVARFNLSLPAERQIAPTVSAIDTRPTTGPSIWAIAGILIAVGLVGLVGYEWWQLAQGNNTSTIVASTPAPQPAGPGPGSLPPAANASPSASEIPRPAGMPAHQIGIKITERSWLRVTIDGKTELEGILPAGTSRTFTGNVADIRVGNAGGVTVLVDGKPAVPLGKPGDVVEQRYVL